MCHEPADKPVQADVNVIRFEFETKKVAFMTWIAGKLNPADVLTKKDFTMLQSLQLILLNGEIPIDLSSRKLATLQPVLDSATSSRREAV